MFSLTAYDLLDLAFKCTEDWLCLVYYMPAESIFIKIPNIIESISTRV